MKSYEPFTINVSFTRAKPVNVRFSLPVVVSHTFMVESRELIANICSFSLAKEDKNSEWPVNVNFTLLVVESQILTVLSQEPVAICC